MMGRTHIATGVTSGAWLATAGAAVGVPAPLLVIGVVLSAYSAILPDLDHRRSTVTLSMGPLTMAVSWVLRQFVDHRGPTHTPRAAPVFGAAVAGPLSLLPAPLGGWSALWWFVVVTVGCLTHVWGDARTLSGTPWRGRGREVTALGRVVASTEGGRLRIGRAFRTGSDYEEWRLHVVYVPSMLVALMVGAFALRLLAR